VSIWFVTPAWRRYALSAVCFEQRRRVIETLAAAGVEAHCVVIADDANLDIARSCGFEVVERDNRYLGRKFNDGMEYAGTHGATWIVPIGSDSWIDPAYLLPLPEPGETRTSPLYTVVMANRLAELRVKDGRGAGPFMIHRDLLAPCGFRPSKDDLPRGIDTATLRGIRAKGGVIEWRERNLHAYQYVGFRGKPTLSSYGYLKGHHGVRERLNPWAVLTAHYPVDLVKRARLAL
jgi:hypothetical protein